MSGATAVRSGHRVQIGATRSPLPTARGEGDPGAFTPPSQPRLASQFPKGAIRSRRGGMSPGGARSPRATARRAHPTAETRR